MPRFAANLTMLFNEVGFMERFAAAARAGFTGVEYLFPYEYAPDQLADRLRQHGLEQVLFNLPAGNWGKGERGIACLPDRVQEFRDGVASALEYAKILGCPRLNCLAGIAPAGVDPELLTHTLIANLKFAAGELERAGVELLIEPINTYDIPGFFVTGTRQALQLIAAAGPDNIHLQYDIYHMQRMEGELAGTLRSHLERIGHVQLADNPGRHEPGTGEINYPFLFKLLDGLGYPGWVGCEYKPASTTLEGLGWLQGI